jgi:FAD-dependent oxidoreductase domain-containing protein 1
VASIETRVETLIIGAGLIGSSLAMHLARRGMSGIRVVDFDLEGSLSSSELNAGAVRATWSQAINVQMSQISIDYFAELGAEVGYNPCGYLWLQTKEKMERALKTHDLQLKMGWPVEVWDVPKLRSRVPFIDKTDDLVGAIFSPRDGLVNSNLLKNHFRSEAKKLGVQFDDRIWVRASEHEANGTTVICEKIEESLSPDAKRAHLSGDAVEYRRSQVQYRAKQVVNCAGAWAAKVAEALGYKSPVHAIRREVCVFDCRDVDLTQYGMIVDTSGVYFHPEASNGLAGFARKDEAQGINFHYDADSFFNDIIWPALYERSSSFERLKHLTGWSGQYEVSPDDSAVIGKVESGEAGKRGNVFESHSFSGHGVMHCHAAGMALAEKMILGRYECADVDQLSARRFETGKLVPEGLVI